MPMTTLLLCRSKCTIHRRGVATCVAKHHAQLRRKQTASPEAEPAADYEDFERRAGASCTAAVHSCAGSCASTAQARRCRIHKRAQAGEHTRTKQCRLPLVGLPSSHAVISTNFPSQRGHAQTARCSYACAGAYGRACSAALCGQRRVPAAQGGLWHAREAHERAQRRRAEFLHRARLHPQLAGCTCDACAALEPAAEGHCAAAGLLERHSRLRVAATGAVLETACASAHAHGGHSMQLLLLWMCLQLPQATFQS